MLQSKFLKDYAQTHEALSKLGTSLPTVLFGGASAPAVGGFGSLADSYSTSEVMHYSAPTQNAHMGMTLASEAATEQSLDVTWRSCVLTYGMCYSIYTVTGKRHIVNAQRMTCSGPMQLRKIAHLYSYA